MIAAVKHNADISSLRTLKNSSRIQSTAKPVLNLHSGLYLGHYGCDYIYILSSVLFLREKKLSGQLTCLDYVTGFASLSVSENSNFSSFF